uniref:C2H2-type domain-containing protein n=1 Tax=Anopheles coluzzii TaxID=1518534 RepID=A0A8W7P514_ANOCL
MDIFQNQCSESLGFDSMLSSNHLHSPLHDSPCSPTNPYAPQSPYFSSISQQPTGHTSGPNDVILPSIFVKIPTQINQQYQQQESRLLRSTHHSTASEIKCEERSDSIKSEIADTRVRLAGNGLASTDHRLPDVIDNYLNDTDRVEPAEVEPNVRTCDRCPFATLSEVRLSEHRRERHPGGGVGVGPQEPLAEKLSCPVCENKFYKKAVLELHLTEDHEMLASEVAALGHSTVTTLQSERSTAPEVRIEPASQQNCVEIPPGPPAATPTATSTATHSKSRIYIKDVQLLKKPDVIAQESHDAQGQQLLSTEQEPSAIAHGTLQDSHQLSLGEDMLPSLDQSLELPPQQQPCAVSGNKIFIRNVSLLQNVNFVASAENMLTNGNGNRYGTAPPPSPQPPPPSSYLSMDCANDGSGALLDTINGGYGGTIAAQPAPSAVAQSSRGSRIYIKNVDILRNHPLIALDDPGVPCTNSLSTTTFSESIATSRASSCESIICTSTPPATATEQQQPPTVPVPSSMTNNSLGAVSQANDQPLLHGTEISYATVGADGMGNPARPLPLSVDQGSQNLLMHFSTSLDGTPGGGSVGEPNVSYLTASSNMSVQQGGEYGTLPQPPPPPAQCDVQQQTTDDVPQQQPRKSKIFIKNISVLKQPTIHLKSVDEVNLMTYDELQNILPTVGGMSSQVGMDCGGDTIGGPLEQHEAHEQHTLDGANRLDKPFGGLIEMNAHHSPELVEHDNVEQHGDGDDDDVMDGYHESDLGYSELSDVCDFTEGFNDRDDPGGGGGGGGAAGVGGIDMTACIANDDTNHNGHLVAESTHCEPTLPPGSGFTGDVILLQEESDASEKITPNHEWAAIVEPANGGGPPLGQDILQQPMEMSDGNEANPLRREEDLLLGNSHPHVINLDPPNEYHPPVGDSEAIVLAAAVNPSIGETQQPVDALTPSQEEANVSGVTALAEPDRPRTRGRPKGAKQTGITKLKKLYTNLTVEEEGYKCDLKDCGVRFRQPDRLDYHRKCHVVAPDSPNPIHCPECGSLEFRNWNTLHTHLWREHAIDMELYACHLCSFKTPVLCRLNNTHMKIHSEERNFKCAICGKAFKNNKQLRNHRRWHREPQQQQQQQQQPQHQEAPVVEEQQPVSQPPPVEEPPAIGPTQSNDASQGDKPKAKPTSIQQSTMKCVKCGLRFAGKRQLRTHMDAKHPTEAGEPGSTEVSAAKHRCLLCGMVFRTRYLLQSHAAKHSDEKRFKCEHCEYTTNDHNAFRRHKMRHSTKGGHMYKCSYCDYSSIQSTTYRKHLERMHAEVASALLYKCAKCPFVSISEAKYQLHRTKHQEEGGEARERPAALGVEPLQGNDPEQQQRQCESVNSDVVIVEQQQQQDAVADGLSASPMDVELLGVDATGGGLQIIQHPIIRPAMFANNFSKVDNFYGYQPAQQHGQPFASSPRGMCPSPQVSCAVGLMPTPTTPIPVPVSGQLVTEQHEYVHLANAVTGDVLMRELN